jgi:hypothetical protein
VTLHFGTELGADLVLDVLREQGQNVGARTRGGWAVGRDPEQGCDLRPHGQSCAMKPALDGLDAGFVAHPPREFVPQNAEIGHEVVLSAYEDTLLIRGTGRTDFQNGDPRAQYESLFGKLLTLPDETLVYPAHDYKGWTMSTIGEEKANNPRLQLRSEREYVELMRGLKLSNPKLMDVAVPANLAGGVA